MADKKLTDLTALTGSNLASGDLFYVVDISEPTAADKSKKITYSELQTVFLTSSSTVEGGTYA
jgi:hypothetical protein